MDVKWYQGYFNVHRQLTGYPDRDGNHRSKFRDHQDTEGFRHMDAVLLQSSVIDRRTGCCSFTGRPHRSQYVRRTTIDEAAERC